MALAAGEVLEGGGVHDAQGRPSYTSGSGAPPAGSFWSGGFLRDADGRKLIAIETLGAAPSAGSYFSGGRLRDAYGRMIVAQSSGALGTGQYISGGDVLDAQGRLVLAGESLGAAITAGDFSSSGLRDQYGRRVGAGLSAFSPASLAGLAGWWKADGQMTPADIINRVPNPSFEVNTSGWQSGATLFVGAVAAGPTRTTSQSIAGAASCSFDVNASGQGLTAVMPGFTFKLGVAYRFRLWVRSSVATTCDVYIGDTVSGENSGPTGTAVGNSGWTLITGTWTPTADRTSCAFAVRSASATAATFYIDGAMVTEGSTQLGYFDGDTPGYGWTGTPHASSSSNTATVTNLVTNPSFEVDTAGWATSGLFDFSAGATVTRQASGGYIGNACAQLVCTGSFDQGMGIPLSGTFKAGVPYTMTARVKATPSALRFSLELGKDGGHKAQQDFTMASTNGVWTEYRITWTPVSDTVGASAIVRSAFGEAVTILVDAVGVFAGTNNSGYFDGSMSGCSWSGTAHASTSTRPVGGVVNGVTTPSLEYGLGGWSNNDSTGLGVIASTAATLSRDTSTAKFGTASLKVQTTTAQYQGAALTFPRIAKVDSTNSTIRIWMKGAVGGEQLTVYAGQAGGYGATPVTLTTSWAEYSFQAATGATLANFGITIRQGDTTAKTFWIDGVFFADGALAGNPFYFDGDSSGAVWTGAAGASASVNLLAQPDGTAIAAWKDSSGLGRTALQATSTKQPAYKAGIQNGLPVLRFDGTDDGLLTSAFSQSQQWTVFAVVRSTTATGTKFPVSTDGLSIRHAQLLRMNGSTLESVAFNTLQAAFIDGEPYTPTSWALIGAGRDASSVTARVNGTAAASTATTGTPASGSGALAVGWSEFDGGFYWSGDIAEILYYNTALSDTDRQSVEAYLKAKWATP